MRILLDLSFLQNLLQYGGREGEVVGMLTRVPFVVAIVLSTCLLIGGQSDSSDDWQSKHPAWIWFDDFELDRPLADRYFEHQDDDGDFKVVARVGRDGSRGLRAVFQKGEVSAGSLKKSFGHVDNPYIARNAARPEDGFSEVYWRFWFRRQEGWRGGGGAKLSRATAMVGRDSWAQGLIAHLWSGGDKDSFLLIDPASGIDSSGVLRSTRYNDFKNLRWLGNKPGKYPLFAAKHAGKWFCIEAHIKLNSPDESDGVFEYWINGQLQVRSENLNWHGDWNVDPERPLINAIFLENYWNAGSPVTQERYFDDFVISTARIGCGCDGAMEE